MDGSCQAVVEKFAKRELETTAMALLFSEAFFDLCVFVFCVVSIRRARSFPTPSFQIKTFLKLAGAGMLFICCAQCLLNITPFVSTVEFQPGKLIDQHYGNPYFATWQLLYTAGISLLDASKVLVLLRLLEFSEKSKKVSTRKIKCIRLSLWSIWSVFSVSGIICAVILLIDSLNGRSKQLFTRLTAVIVVIRCAEFFMLAAMFAYSGVTRWVPIANAAASH
jgi:hypothetical protein